jgi:cephalosporin hydroxylase
VNKLRVISEKHHAEKPVFYLDVYESIFAKLRNKPLSIFEIGTFQGGSLKTWEEYFPLAKIFGLDLIAPAAVLGRQTRFYQGEQTDLDLLQKIASDSNGFDIIIDDCSHKADDWLASFNALISHVRKGGYYIIEDIKAPYNADWINWMKTTDPTMSIEDERRKLVENLATIMRPVMMHNDEQNIEYVSLYQHLVVIKKLD